MNGKKAPRSETRQHKLIADVRWLNNSPTAEKNGTIFAIDASGHRRQSSYDSVS